MINIKNKIRIISTGILTASAAFMSVGSANIFAQEVPESSVEVTETEAAKTETTETENDIIKEKDKNTFESEGLESDEELINETEEKSQLKTMAKDADTKKETDTKNNAEKKTDTKKTDNKKTETLKGWVKDKSGAFMYYGEDGEAYTGWHWMTKKEGEKTDHWNYFGSDGKLYTGWHWMTEKEGEKTDHWSYFGSNGWLRTGWVQLGKGTNEPDGNKAKHWSYFGANGWLRTGWVQLGKGTNDPDGNKEKHWSYFGENGWLRTGWAQLGKGTNNPDGKAEKHWSYFGENGWLRTGWKQLGKGTSNPDGNAEKHWSYFGDNGWLRTNWVELGKGTKEPDGNKTRHYSYFGSNGWLRTSQWYKDKNGAHWFDNRGWMVTNNPVVEGQLYNDKNGNGALTKNTSKNGWYSWNDNWYWLVNGATLKGFTGVTQINNKGDWYHIKDGATTGIVKNEAIVAHASGDEREKFVGGVAGDQIKGEVYFKTWFKRPWQYVIRANDARTREKIAYAMERAALNEHIGYDMYQRNTLYNLASKVGWDPGKVTADCETDCSACVAVALRYAGFSEGVVRISSNNCFTTSSMRNKLKSTGKFTIYSSKDYIESADKLIRGDILLLENGHTAVVTKSKADMK